MNNPGQGLQDSPLVIYGGLVAELNPSDLPEGSAAICCDMDFTVGSVKTRYGVENVYTYANGTDREVVKCASNLITAPNETPWSNPLNITANSPPTYAAVTLGPAGGGGGGGGGVGIQNTKVTLSAAQIKAALVTPVSLIPAQGANIAIVPISAVLELNFVTTAYSQDTNTTIGFGTTPADIYDNGWFMYPANIGNLPIMESTTSTIELMSVTSSGQAAGAFNPLTHIVNQPLYWVNENDLSGDAGDATVTLNIQWIAVNVTTGAIVGGTGTSIYGSMTNLSSGQLQSATLVPLVPAPGANQIIVPISSVIWGHFNTTPMHGQALQAIIGLGTTWTDVYSNGAFALAPFTHHEDQFLMLALSSVGDTFLSLCPGPGAPLAPSTMINQPLSFANVQTPQYTLQPNAGDETVTVYVQYVIVNVATGALASQGQGDLNPSFTPLSTAQINAAYVTPIQLVAAPGPNVINMPISYVATSTYDTVPYSYPGVLFSNSAFTSRLITGINQTGGAGTNYFVVAGNHVGDYTTTLTVENSDAGNNALYHIVSATLVSGNTQVVVTEVIPHPYANSGGVPLPIIGPGNNSALLQGTDFTLLTAATSLFTAAASQILLGTPQIGQVSDDFSGMFPSEVINQPILWADATNNAGNTADSTGAAMTQYLGVNLVTGEIVSGGLNPVSQVLRGQCYGFSVPASSSVIDVVVQINGKQSGLDLGSIVRVVRLDTGEVLRTTQLPTSDGVLCFDLGNDFTPAQINSSGFGLGIQAFASGVVTTFDVSGMVASVYYTAPDVAQFNYVKTFAMTDGEVLTLALDDTGVFWQENVGNEITTCSGTFGVPMTANVLTPFYTEILPDTFAKSVTYDDREWIALSDLQMGTDMPRQYNGQWVDRVSQVGPGVAPTFSATGTVYDIVSITQPGPVSGLHALLWSVGPGQNHQAGNVITIYYSDHTPNPPDPNLYVGGGVVLSGFSTSGGNDPNGSYVITSIGLTVAGGGSGVWNTFTVQAPSSALIDSTAVSGGSYQASLSTITLATPAPGVQVGTQILIAGTSVSALDASWTILNALNAAQLNITATSLTGNVATYDYTLITGTAPVAGQQVTVTGTTNGNGIFNVVNGVISGASPSNFSLAIISPDIAAAAEDGAQAIINGTIFQFDPGPTWVGSTPTNPTEPFIFGTSTGGTIVQPGQLGAGVRMAVVLFKTRNGFLTPTSPFATFTTPEGASSINVSNIPIGPPNVIARVIALTGAGGAFYFWIPEPVTVTSNGQQVTYDATIINDNSSTSATFNIADGVLLTGGSIDTQGSNNFAQIELGSCLGFIAYSQRMFAWGEQNKIQNMLNLSFDGGYLAQNPATPPFPAGWTADPTYGNGGSLLVSPLFGNSYYIKNATGSTQPFYGMIQQDAFEDQLAEPIIEVQKQYQVRVTARCPSGVTTGNLVIDLYSPSFNRIYGSFSVPLASMTDAMQIFTGNLLTSAFTIAVPNDLLYRIYASGIPDGGDVEIDRSEPFDLAEPVLSTQLRGSYFANFEAFDGVTGNLGVGVENQQSVVGAFELFDNLYVLRTASFAETTDNGITEPDGWTVKETSNKVGTASIHSYDVGEGWALTAGLPGLYLFEGGKPQKISPEIDPLWQAINWKYGYTIWLRNDTNNRRIVIGVPLATPNRWMPSFPVNANPTQPNIVLTCTYKELMTAGALASEGSIRQGFTGQLRTFQLGRRWSVWSIEAAYADFIQRDDTTTPIFFCSDTSPKIYQQITGNYLDDGEGILDKYVTYPFLQSQEAQQIRAGLHELLATYGSALLVGEGNVNITILPDTLGTPYGDALEPLELGNPPAWGDTEFPLNDVGSRFFVQFETLEPGDWFELSRLVLTVTQNPWAPVRGSN